MVVDEAYLEYVDDPALESGSNIEYTMLAPATKRAWLRAAAVMMDPYAR